MEKELVNLTREVPCHMLIMHLDHLCFLVTIFGSLLSAEIYTGGYGCGSRFSFQRLQRIHQWIGDARYGCRLQVSIGQVVSLTRVLNLVQLREPVALPGEERTFRIGDTRLVTQWLQLLARDRVIALWTYAIGWIGMIDGRVLLVVVNVQGGGRRFPYGDTFDALFGNDGSSWNGWLGCCRRCCLSLFLLLLLLFCYLFFMLILFKFFFFRQLLYFLFLLLGLMLLLSRLYLS